MRSGCPTRRRPRASATRGAPQTIKVMRRACLDDSGHLETRQIAESVVRRARQQGLRLRVPRALPVPARALAVHARSEAHRARPRALRDQPSDLGGPPAIARLRRHVHVARCRDHGGSAGGWSSARWRSRSCSLATSSSTATCSPGRSSPARTCRSSSIPSQPRRTPQMLASREGGRGLPLGSIRENPMAYKPSTPAWDAGYAATEQRPRRGAPAAARS